MSIQNTEQEYNNLLKSKSDSLTYKLKILPNLLKILFISDQNANKSAAALSVNIGSLTDSDIQGLAHFCEHLLTMGSEKYPNENEYESFLTSNGGESNAQTSDDRTVFYFDVKNDAFEGALDRFAQYFICPIFSKDSVEREINAVNSEFSKNLNSDPWRLKQIKCSDTNKNSKFNRFSTGNKETLIRDDIRDKLISMHKKYYSSEMMNLVVYSKKDMEELVDFVEGLFKQVPKIENFIPPRYDEIMPYDESNLKYFYKVFPIEDSDEIQLIWYLPFCENYYVNPLSYLTSLFGHEGPNTLTSSLRKDNLINTLIAGESNEAKTFSTFEISVSLTKKGIENYKEVILRILKYIKSIQKIGVNERYFNELKTINQLQFDYQNKTNPMTYCKVYAINLIKYKPEDVLVGESIFREYDEKLIKKYLDLLVLDNLNIFFLSKILEKECNLTEKWYGTKYTKEKLNITLEEINSYKCDDIFDYPPVNKFLPKNIDILPIPENLQKYPENLIKNNKNLEIWYLQDGIFNMPKAYIIGEYLLPIDLCNNSVLKNKVIAQILSEIIDDELGELIYMASEAYVNFESDLSENKFTLSIFGFNDSLKDGLCEILNKINEIDLTSEKIKEKFDIKIKEYIKDVNNLFLEISYSVNIKYLKVLMNDPSLKPDAPLEILNSNKITIDDLINFKNNIFKNTKSKWLIQGNISKENALNIVQNCNQIFNVDINKKIIKKFDSSRAVKINKNQNFIYRFKNPNNNQKDSSLIRLYQTGHLNDTEYQYFKIIHLFLRDKFYDILRNKETLGYVVDMIQTENDEIYSLLCVIQSSDKIPEYCCSRVKNFMKNKIKDIHEMTDEIFINLVNSRIAIESKKFNNLKEFFKYNWNEIKYNTYEFDKKEKNIEILKNCKKEKVIEFFDKYFVNEPKILDCEYVCDSHYEENEKVMKETKIDEEEKIDKRIIVDEIEDFKLSNMLYPDYLNSHKNFN